jgi:PPK2 family polyphosphate:nucleotide phosphotransferase
MLEPSVDLAAYRTPRATLASVDPSDTGPFDREAGGRKEAAALLARLTKRLATLQHLLYADGRFAVLLVLQAKDAGGKDGTIRRVLSGLNPQGVRVTSFKAPTAIELSHDFLWRIHRAVPPKGHIGVFNRSHYEDVLVARVDGLVPELVWRGRFDHIVAFERLLQGEGTSLVKVYLHVDRDEQGKRLRKRLADPSRHWKFDPGDLRVRSQWDAYQEAYEEAFARTGDDGAPWLIVPANRKWYRDLVVTTALVEALEALPLEWPVPTVDPAAFEVSD